MGHPQGCSGEGNMDAAVRVRSDNCEVQLPGERTFNRRLEAWARDCACRWRTTESDLPTAGKTFDQARQRDNEVNCDRFLDRLECDLRSIPDSRRRRSRWRAGLLHAIKRFAESTLGLAGTGLDLVFSDECIEASRLFLRRAHAFDPDLEPADLSQALRNVWVMNCIQILLGLRPCLTPSIQAYSLLYPYTDNYLDHPDTSPGTKAAFNLRLGLRLRGIPVSPADSREEVIFRLVKMIEIEYPRNRYPEVYLSLLAIHRGQVHSLRQQRASESLFPEELLAISIEKGGASVLADGYLVSGALSEEDARFCFELGVFLQLADDLQDLPTDLAFRHETVFSRDAGVVPLDAPTDRLLRFLTSVLASLACADSARGNSLKELLERNSLNLVLRSVAHSREYFTDAFVRQMECYSPLRFDYLRRAEPQLEARLRHIQASIRSEARTLSDLLN